VEGCGVARQQRRSNVSPTQEVKGARVKKAVLITFLATASAVALPIAAVSSGSTAGESARGTKPAIIAGNVKCLLGWLSAPPATRPSIGSTASTARMVDCAREQVWLRHHRQNRGIPLPASTAAAVDGHYKGVTSQSETFEFDIDNGGRNFRRAARLRPTSMGTTSIGRTMTSR
jgi:hypothetical protein